MSEIENNGTLAPLTRRARRLCKRERIRPAARSDVRLEGGDSLERRNVVKKLHNAS